MSWSRCQICGRRKGLSVRGTILAHYVKGRPCPGTGFGPIEQTDARLVAVRDKIVGELQAARRELKALLDARANWIEPSLYQRINDLAATRDRLDRRIARLESWPRRFVRDMERQGWGSPPPAYLAQRHGIAA